MVAVVGLKKTFRDKIITREQACQWNLWWKTSGKSVVFTNGCFDLLTAAHVRFLESAKGMGDRLLIAVNTDSFVRLLKGEGRPLREIWDRLAVIGALSCVDAVFPFADSRVTDLLRELKPTIWAKGGDYTIETLDKSEVESARHCNVRIEILPREEGDSTTETVAKIKSNR